MNSPSLPDDRSFFLPSDNDVVQNTLFVGDLILLPRQTCLNDISQSAFPHSWFSSTCYFIFDSDRLSRVEWGLNKLREGRRMDGWALRRNTLDMLHTSSSKWDRDNELCELLSLRIYTSTGSHLFLLSFSHTSDFAILMKWKVVWLHHIFICLDWMWAMEFKDDPNDPVAKEKHFVFTADLHIAIKATHDFIHFDYTTDWALPGFHSSLPFRSLGTFIPCHNNPTSQPCCCH